MVILYIALFGNCYLCINAEFIDSFAIEFVCPGCAIYREVCIIKSNARLGGTKTLQEDTEINQDSPLSVPDPKHLSKNTQAVRAW